MLTPTRDKLKQVLLSKSVLRGEFVLASKESSDVYIDARTTTLDPEGVTLISEIFFYELEKYEGIKVVGCPWSVGAGPIVGCMVAESFNRKEPLYGLMVRKEEKGYGTGKIVEWHREELTGSKVVMVEDVVNTGKSVLDAIKSAEKDGAKIQAVFCVIDRGKETEKVFEEQGYKFFSIFKFSEFT